MTTTPPTPITYPDLLAKCIGETENTSGEYAAQFPQIVQDAERMILEKLDVLNLHVYSDTNLGAALVPGQNAYIAIPNDCVLIRYVEVFIPQGLYPSQDDQTDQFYGTKVVLRRMDETALQDWWPNVSKTGVPRYYAVLGATRNADSPNGQLLIAPTPGLPYNVRMGYLGWPDPMTPANPITYLSRWHSYLLFLACMVRSSAFMKNLQQAQLWESLFQDHMQDAMMLESRRKAEGYADASRTTAPLKERSQ